MHTDKSRLHRRGRFDPVIGACVIGALEARVVVAAHCDRECGGDGEPAADLKTHLGGRRHEVVLG